MLLPFLFRGPNLCRQFYIISHLRNSAHQFHKTDSIFHLSELHDNRLPISMYIKFIYSRSSQKIIIGQRKFFQTYHIDSQNRLAFLIIQEIENNILFFFKSILLLIKSILLFLIDGQLIRIIDEILSVDPRIDQPSDNFPDFRETRTSWWGIFRGYKVL